MHIPGTTAETHSGPSNKYWPTVVQVVQLHMPTTATYTHVGIHKAKLNQPGR